VARFAASATGDPALASARLLAKSFYTEAAVHGGIRINQMTDNTMTVEMLGIKAVLRVLLAEMLDEQAIDSFRAACAEVIAHYPENMRRDALGVVDNLLDLAA
jgi:hypothetical protein